MEIPAASQRLSHQVGTRGAQTSDGQARKTSEVVPTEPFQGQGDCPACPRGPSFGLPAAHLGPVRPPDQSRCPDLARPGHRPRSALTRRRCWCRRRRPRTRYCGGPRAAETRAAGFQRPYARPSAWRLSPRTSRRRAGRGRAVTAGGLLRLGRDCEALWDGYCATKPRGTPVAGREVCWEGRRPVAR